MMITRLSPKTAVAMGISESGKTLQQRLTGSFTNAFLVARDPMSRMGFYGDDATSLAARHDLGPAGLTVTAERGEVYRPGPNRSGGRPGYTVGTMTLDRRVGPATIAVAGSRLDEQGSVLGGRMSATLGAGGATSWFLDGSASLDMGSGWAAYGSYRRGLTQMPGSGGLASDGRLSTDAWAFDVSKAGAVFAGDNLALRVMQPLRVRSGGYDLSVPISYDYTDGSVGYAQRFFNLAPTGREIDFEAAYGLGLWGGQMSANAFLRRQPGHIATMKNDTGLAFRFSRDF
jgi:hypothetical protein